MKRAKNKTCSQAGWLPVETLVPIAIVIWLMMWGCGKDPFSTRSFEDPLSTGGTYTDPVSADLAVTNLFFAYNERNLSNVTRGLAEDFIFAFDYLNIGQPGGTTEWTETEEARVTDNIFRAMDTVILNWAVSQTDIEDDSSAIYYRAYDILVVTATSPPETTSYSGESVFYLNVTEAARWEINRWEDRHGTGEQFSWADLKSRYR
jgi:hypothetical protein